MGDSWAADWSSKYTEYQGWPNILAEQLTVTNIAQAGVSQYSILKQLQNTTPADYDAVIISITSPYRLYTPKHPVHTEGLHENSDLIYTDLEYHLTEQPDNKRIQSAIGFYKHHFDTEHAEYMHQLLVEDTLKMCDPETTIVTSNIAHNEQYVKQHQYVDGYPVWQTYPGRINHLSAEGNDIFASNIRRLLS